MAGELKPRIAFAVGQELEGVWRYDKHGVRGQGPTKPPEEWSRTRIVVTKVARKYVYFQVGEWRYEYRQLISSPSRMIGDYEIELPELDAYERLIEDAKACLKAYGFTDYAAMYAFSGVHDADLIAAAHALKVRNGLVPDSH